MYMCVCVCVRARVCVCVCVCVCVVGGLGGRGGCSQQQALCMQSYHSVYLYVIINMVKEMELSVTIWDFTLPLSFIQAHMIVYTHDQKFNW